jgi:hypothetical protein
MDDGGNGEDGASTSGGPKNLAEKIARLKTKRDRHQALLGDLERSGDKQISLSDPGSRLMFGGSRTKVGYNVQIAVDCKH